MSRVRWSIGNSYLNILIAVALTALSFSPASAARGGRVASDLRDQIQRNSPSQIVRVLVNLRNVDPTVFTAKVRDLGGDVKKHLKNVDEMVIDLPLGSVPALSDLDGIEYIAPDRPVSSLFSHLETTTGASLQAPTSLSFLNLSSTLSAGLDGTGVTVAVIDSGMDAEHYDLKDESRGRRRVLYAWDFVGNGNLDDPYGHGTHVAAIVAGDGSAGAPNGRDYSGIAPNANLINFRVLDEQGRGFVSNVVAAIDQAIALRSLYNVRVINLSLAAPPIDSYVNDPMCRAIERAVKAGIVVVAAAGNFGQDSNGQKVYGGVASPGISPAAITVGAVNTRGTNTRSDDTIAPFSSRGPTLSRSVDPVTGAVTVDKLAKPDLVAPGARIVSAERAGNYLVTTYPALHVETGNLNSKARYMALSGSSMAAAVVSGAVALLAQANPALTPNQIKAILEYSAQMIDGADLFEQGAGLLNVDGAARLAKSLSKNTYSLPGTLLAANGLPAPQSSIAGETVAFSQGLIWNFGLLRGEATISVQQTANAQSLIWGRAGYDVWGAGVTYYDGLYSDDFVPFAKNNQWSYLVYDNGTTTASGLIWTTRLYASGLIWGNQAMCADFFTLNSTSLIWNYRSGDSSLIWGLNDSGLIWGAW